jgi:hypothetical protein
VTWREGTQGKLSAKFAWVRVRPGQGWAEGACAGADPIWLLIEERADGKIQYGFSNLPARTSRIKADRLWKSRWPEETTFQEMRPSLGLETTRGGTEATVLRLAPCLFGLFSVVALLDDLLPGRIKAKARVDWAGKVETTFSDAIMAVRRWLWVDWVFANHGFGETFSKLSRPFQEALLSALAPSA